MDSFVIQEHLSVALKNAIQSDEYDAEDVSILEYTVSTRLGEDNTSNCADVVSVQVNYECQKVKKQKSLIFKVPFNHPHYEIVRKLGLYETETKMYQSVLPKLNAVLPRPISPQCYLFADRDTLVMEDLSVLGYRNGPARLDFNHCVILFKTMAKFQAASYKLSLEDSTLLSVISQEQFYPSNVVVLMSDKMFSLYELLMREEGINASSIERLEAVKNKLVANPTLSSDNLKFDMNVLNHGGLKSPNIMFLYDHKGQYPISAKLVDFQTCRWSSPVSDIIGICSMTMQFTDFENKFCQLKEIYLQSFNQWLTLLECDRIYEEDEFEADMEKLELFRIYMFFSQGYLGVQQILNVVNLNPISCNEMMGKVIEDKEFMQTFLGWVRYFQNIGLL